MENPYIKKTECNSTTYFMDWCGWSSIILLDNKVIFSCNRYAHDIVLDYVARFVIDEDVNIPYLIWKCRERWATKKDCDFVKEMLEHFVSMRKLWQIIER